MKFGIVRSKIDTPVSCGLWRVLKTSVLCLVERFPTMVHIRNVLQVEGLDVTPLTSAFWNRGWSVQIYPNHVRPVRPSEPSIQEVRISQS